jgi:hypothetical protein
MTKMIPYVKISNVLAFLLLLLPMATLIYATSSRIAGKRDCDCTEEMSLDAELCKANFSNQNL